MPKKIKIVNGPSYQTLMFNGPMFGCFLSCFFTITGEDGKPIIHQKYRGDKDNPCKLQGLSIGVVYNRCDKNNQESVEENIASPRVLSIIFRHDDFNGEQHHFIFRYDIKTHTGDGWYFTEPEVYSPHSFLAMLFVKDS